MRGMVNIWKRSRAKVWKEPLDLGTRNSLVMNNFLGLEEQESADKCLTTHSPRKVCIQMCT